MMFWNWHLGSVVFLCEEMESMHLADLGILKGLLTTVLRLQGLGYAIEIQSVPADAEFTSWLRMMRWSTRFGLMGFQQQLTMKMLLDTYVSGDALAILPEGAWLKTFITPESVFNEEGKLRASGILFPPEMDLRKFRDGSSLLPFRLPVIADFRTTAPILIWRTTFSIARDFLMTHFTDTRHFTDALWALDSSGIHIFYQYLQRAVTTIVQRLLHFLESLWGNEDE